MKTSITTLLFALTAGFAFGHGEVTEKDGKLHIAVLDKDMKPVKVEAQRFIATGGTITAPKSGEWLCSCGAKK